MKGLGKHDGGVQPVGIGDVNRMQRRLVLATNCVLGCSLDVKAVSTLKFDTTKTKSIYFGGF